jgi:hypothetical protein
LLFRRAVAVAAEAEVETGFHDVFGFIDAVDESQPIVLNESAVAITEVVVIVLDEARDKVGECVLPARIRQRTRLDQDAAPYPAGAR